MVKVMYLLKIKRSVYPGKAGKHEFYLQLFFQTILVNQLQIIHFNAWNIYIYVYVELACKFFFYILISSYFPETSSVVRCY